jgi:transcriptional regulator with XRE-family HTH domain
VDEGTDGVGRRLGEIRAWRGLSLRAVADLAGCSAGYLSRVERGERAVDRRSVLEALAHTLRVSPSELTGQPYRPADPVDVAAREQVAELELALSEPALGDTTLPRREPWPELEAQLAQLNAVLRPAADYTAQGRVLPGLLAGLHAAMTREPEHRRAVLFGLLDVYHAAEELTKSLGVPGLPQLAVVHAQRVAEELDEPAALGLAAWLRAIATGGAGRTRVLELSARAVDELSGALADPAAAQMTGALHLTAALASATLNRADDAAAHLDEAQRLARLQPDDAADFGLVYFTPDNVGIWRVALAVELGEPGRAAEIARTVRPDAVPSSARQAMFWADLGRGLATQRGTRDEAVAALRRAEEIAPHTTRNNVYVREAVADLLRRARRDAAGRELRGMAFRMGFAA